MALQASAHACVAACAADVIGEFLGMPGVGAGQVQHQLTDDLGGLRDAGTTFQSAEFAIRARFGRQISVQSGVGIGWEQMLNMQSREVGVIIALAPEAGRGEGHAIRVLGSSRPLRQAEEADLGELTHPRAFTDLAMKVQIFDPWPTNSSPGRLEQHGEVRRRYELAGGQCLVMRLAGRHPTRRS